MPKQATRATPRVKALRKNHKVMSVLLQDLQRHSSTCPQTPREEPDGNPPSMSSKELENLSLNVSHGNYGQSTSAPNLAASEDKRKLDSALMTRGDARNEMQRPDVRTEDASCPSVGNDVEDDYTELENVERKLKSVRDGTEKSEERDQSTSRNSSSAGLVVQETHEITVSDNLKDNVQRNQKQTPPNSPRGTERSRDSGHVKIEPVSPLYSFLDVENLFNSPLQSFYRSTSSQVLNAASHPSVVLHPEALQFLARSYQSGNNKDSDENFSDPFIGEFFYGTNAKRAQPKETIEALSPPAQLPSRPSGDAQNSDKVSSIGMGAKDTTFERTAESQNNSLRANTTTSSQIPAALHLGMNNSLVFEESSDSKRNYEASISCREDVQETEVSQVEPVRTIANRPVDIEVSVSQSQSPPTLRSANLEQLSHTKGNQNFSHQKKRSQKGKNVSKANQGIVSKPLENITNVQNDFLGCSSPSSKNCFDSTDFIAAPKGKKKKGNIDVGLQDEKKIRKKANARVKSSDRVSSGKRVEGHNNIMDSHPANALQLCDENILQHHDSWTDLNDTLRDISQSLERADKTKDARRQKEPFGAPVSVSKPSTCEMLAGSSSAAPYSAPELSFSDGGRSSALKEPTSKEFSQVKRQVKPKRAAQIRSKKSTYQIQTKMELITQCSSSDDITQKILSPFNAPDNHEDLNEIQSLKNFANDQTRVSVENQTSAAEGSFSKTCIKKCTSSQAANKSTEGPRQKKPRKVESSRPKNCAKDALNSSSKATAHDEKRTSTKRKQGKGTKEGSVKKSRNVQGIDAEITNFGHSNTKHSAKNGVGGDKTIFEDENLTPQTACPNIRQAKSELQTAMESESPVPEEITVPSLSPSFKRKRSRAPRKSSGKNVKSTASLKSAAIPEASRNLDLIMPGNNLDQTQPQPTNSECSVQRSTLDTIAPVSARDSKMTEICVESTAVLESNRLLTSSPANYKSFSCFPGNFGSASAQSDNSETSVASVKSSTETSSVFGKCGGCPGQKNILMRAHENKKNCAKQVPKLNLSFQDQMQRTKNGESSFTEFRSVPIDLSCSNCALQNRNASFKNKTGFCMPPNNLSMASMHTNDYGLTNDASCPLECLSISDFRSEKRPKILHAPNLSIVKFPGLLVSAKTNSTEGNNNRASGSFESSNLSPKGNFKCLTSTRVTSERKTNIEFEVASKANKDCGTGWKVPTSFAPAKFCGTSLTSPWDIHRSSPSPTFQNEAARVEMPFSACETKQSGTQNMNANSTAIINNELNEESHQRIIATPGQANCQDEILKVNGREYRALTAKLLLPLYEPLQFLSKVPPQPLILTLKKELRKEKSTKKFDINDYYIHQMGC